MTYLLESKEKRLHYLLHLFIFLAIFVSRAPFISSMTIHTQEWDQVSRFMVAFRARDTFFQYLFPVHWWLPLQFYLMRALKWFSDVPEIMNYLNLTLFTLSFNLIYQSICEFIEDFETKLIVAFFCILCSLNMVLYFISLTALAEPLFFFQLSVGTYFFLKWEKGPVNQWGFIIAFTLGNLLRFESWILTFIFSMFILWDDRKLKTVLKLSLFALVPLIWFYVQYYYTKNFFTWIMGVTFENSLTTTRQIKIHNYLKVLSSFFSLTLPLAALFFFQKSHKTKQLLALFLFYFVLLSYQVYKGLLYPSERYVVHLLFLGIVVVGLQIGQHYVKSTLKKGIVLASFVLLATGQTASFFQKGMHYNLVHGHFPELISYLRTLPLDEKNKLFVPRIEGYDSLIALRLNLVNTPKHIRMRLGYNFFLEPTLLWKYIQEDRMFDRKDIRYIVVVRGLGKDSGHAWDYRPAKLSEEFKIIKQFHFADVYERKKP